MKILHLFLLVITGSLLFANNSEFQYDATVVNQSLKELNKVEQLYKASPEKSLDQIKSEAGYHQLNISSASVINSGMNGDMPILPAFWWGCLLGAIGILIVYLVTEDTDQTKSALWGCVLGVGIWFVFWLVLGLAGAGFWWTF